MIFSNDQVIRCFNFVISVRMKLLNKLVQSSIIGGGPVHKFGFPDFLDDRQFNLALESSVSCTFFLFIILMAVSSPRSKWP